MKNETKLKKLMAWLDENKIEYRQPPKEMRKDRRRRRSDLFIPQYCISVKIDNEYSHKWYSKHYNRNPVFIRTEETPKFIIEKVQNVITRVMLGRQKNYLKRLAKEQKDEK